MKAMGNLAEFLGLEPDVVSKEMKALDFDANNMVSFAEFVLWADKHTIGIPLGIEIPDKREWRKGMPTWWTSIPPPSPEEEALLKAATAGAKGSKSKKSKAKPKVAEDPDTSELEDFIAAAKEGEWETLREILGRHPGYVNMRPPYRRYAAIHQACYHGDVEVIRELASV
ncbi:Bacilysin biosynthesis oxidoreductase BacC [Durusdinium trenchii]|uniref:Bacilysin biosynthesis oxidoreductase BacC n=1 Tax=Durusdinium trenchii TaxID=1381693 RepID=A0ABP0LT78_9DINO